MDEAHPAPVFVLAQTGAVWDRVIKSAFPGTMEMKAARKCAGRTVPRMSCVDGECGEDGGMDTDESREAALRDEIARLRDALGQARRDAMVDALTGCLNRRGWTKSIEVEERRCRRHGLDAVVVMVDLDGLKAVNDERGHAAGDQRLITCARALRSVVRGEDLVARLGGDEFAVLAVQTTSEAPHAIVAHIERAFDAAGVRASLGWALRSSHANLIAAITAADHGMLAMKRHRGREASPVDRGR